MVKLLSIASLAITSQMSINLTRIEIYLDIMVVILADHKQAWNQS